MVLGVRAAEPGFPRCFCSTKAPHSQGDGNGAHGFLAWLDLFHSFTTLRSPSHLLTGCLLELKQVSPGHCLEDVSEKNRATQTTRRVQILMISNESIQDLEEVVSSMIER